MSVELYLGRARLKKDASTAALAKLLLPSGNDARAAAAHSLVWTLFSDSSDRTRDFLWREDAPGVFMTLSARRPADPHDLFDLESKSFEPALSVGDRLGFRMRANPTITHSAGKGSRGKRSDVVMDALRGVPDRAAARPEVIVSAGRAWLAGVGARSGFIPDPDTLVDGYDQRRLERSGGARLRFSILDFEGRLTVQDPVLFISRIVQGFGRAKSFGCGLMLIRRAG